MEITGNIGNVIQIDCSAVFWAERESKQTHSEGSKRPPDNIRRTQTGYLAQQSIGCYTL